LGKKLIIVAFLLCFGLALWLFLTRQTMVDVDAISLHTASTSPIVLDDFVLTSYNGSKLEQTFSGKQATFIASDRILVTGGIKWWKNKDNEMGTVHADSATLFLRGDNSSRYMIDGEVDHVVFSGHVHITANTLMLKTEQATYQVQENSLRGREKVVFTTAQDTITGDNGFFLNLHDESFEIYGTVRGVMIK
jgi:hypothetical protein